MFSLALYLACYYKKNNLTDLPEQLSEEKAIEIIGKKDKNEQCPICLESILGDIEEPEKISISISVPPCGHPIHTECAKKLLKSLSTCPSCRGQVSINGKNNFTEVENIKSTKKS